MDNDDTMRMLNSYQRTLEAYSRKAADLKFCLNAVVNGLDEHRRYIDFSAVGQLSDEMGKLAIQLRTMEETAWLYGVDLGQMCEQWYKENAA